MARLQDLQRGQQFALEKVAPVIAIGQRCQRMDDIVAAHVGSVVGFHAPDGKDDFGLDAIALLGSTQCLGPLPAHAPTVGHARGRYCVGNILTRRLDRFGLAAREAHDAVGRRKACKGLLEYGAGNATRGRFGPDRGNEIGDIGKGRARQNERCASAQPERDCTTARKNGEISRGGGATHGGTFSASNRQLSCHAFMARRCPPPTDSMG